MSKPDASLDLLPWDSARGLTSVELLGKSANPKRAARIILGLAIAGALCLLLPWQQNIRGDGRVTALSPADRPQTVVSTIDGRIEQWYVAEGQYVNAGDSLIRLGEVKDQYFDPLLAQRYRTQITAKEQENAAKLDKVDALTRQIAQLEQALAFKRQQVVYKINIDSAEVAAAELAVQVAQRQLEGQQALYDQGLKSLTELEQRRLKLQESVAKLQSAQNKLISSRVELNAVEAEYRKDIAKAEADRSATLAEYSSGVGALAETQSKASAFDVRRNYYVLRAPQSGFVVRALKAGIGEQVKAQDGIVTIMPGDPSLAAEVYVSANDVVLLRKGQQVRLQFDGWPALQFAGWPSISVGTFGGRIQVVDYTVSVGGKYRVLVVPDPAEEPWPNANLLRQGSGVFGWAMLNEVPVWFELWRQLNGFPPSLPGVPVMDVPEGSGGKSEADK
ncbi:MAG: HlyD family efflux transporter periplasmic adaptor subunit [Bacteroidia bacterium]|nr:HlyD family efflux transporter periplasmic adaptor subunit [Bacteroidia bacterium]